MWERSVGTNSELRHHTQQRETYSKLCKLHGIELAVGEQSCLIVLSPILSLKHGICSIYDAFANTGRTHENCLTHEWEILCVPSISIPQTRHENVREGDSNSHVDLIPERQIHAAAADVVPIEAQRKQAHSFVIACSTEYVPDGRAVIIRQAEYRNSSENRENPYQRKLVGWICVKLRDRKKHIHSGKISQQNATPKIVQNSRTRLEVIWLS